MSFEDLNDENYLHEQKKKLEEWKNEKYEEISQLRDEINYLEENNEYLIDQIQSQKDQLYSYELKLQKMNRTNLASYIDDTRSENSMLLNAKSNRSTSRINDLSYNLMSNFNKTSDGLTKNCEDDSRSIISGNNFIENEKSDKAKGIKDEEDSELILHQMLNMLNDYNKSIKNIEREVKTKKKEARVSLICDSVLVIAIDSNETDSENFFNLQTFRIDSKTTIKSLRNSIYNFWQFCENEQEFSLFILENNNSQIEIRHNDDTENNLTVEAFCKGTAGLQKVQFLFIHNSKLSSKARLVESFRTKEKEYSREKNQKSSDEIVLSTPVKRLFNMFAGLSEYLKVRYLKKQIKKQKIIDDENYEKRKKKKEQENDNQSVFSVICNLIFKFLHFTFLIVFAYLSMYSTSDKEPDEKAYLMRKVANDVIKMPDLAKADYFFSKSILSDLYNQLKILGKQTTYFSFTMITPIRFTFSHKENNCTSNFTVPKKNATKTICKGGSTNNETYFEIDDDYIKKTLENDPTISPIVLNSPNMSILHINDKTNKITDYLDGDESLKFDKLVIYFHDLFKEFTDKSNTARYFEVDGYENEYDGSSFSFSLNPNMVSEEIFQIAMGLVLKHPEKTNLLTSVIATYVLYNPNFDFYFYYTILYEITDNYVTFSSLKMDLFRPNIYKNILTGVENYSIISADLTRFLINIFFTFFFLKEFLKELSENAQKPKRPSAISTLMQAKFLIELVIICLYFTRYALKNFYSSSVQNLKALLNFEDKIRYNSIYTKQTYNEFYRLKDFYITDKLYDILLFFISYVRFIGYFIYNPKMKDFLSFIFDALTRIAYFMMFYLIVLIFLCVLSNNLFGLQVEEFKDFISSFSYILLFCNGHNHLIKAKMRDYSTWEMIFIFMIFIMIVFFLNSVFFGIYLEAFRLVSWKTGYSNQKKKMKLFSEKILNLLTKKDKKGKNNENNQDEKDQDNKNINIEMQEKKANIV